MSMRDDVNRFLTGYLVWSGKAQGTRDGYLIDLSQFMDFMEGRYNGQIETSGVSREDIEDFLTCLKTCHHLAPASICRKLAALKSFFAYATDHGLTTFNPAGSIKSPRRPQRLPIYLTSEEIDRLAAGAANDTIRAVIWTLYYSGMRVGEVVNLVLGDVDFATNLLTIRQAKGGKERVVPLNTKLAAILQAYLEHTRAKVRSCAFFATRSGKISTHYIANRIDRAAEVAGIQKKVSPHTLRHSFATGLYQRGVGLQEIATLLGHASVQTTTIYTHLSPWQLSRAVELLQ